MKSMSVDMLRSFVTVYEKGRFSHAAQLLNRSQPTISTQIKRLEELVGKDLMIRGSSNIELTYSGNVLIDYAKKILDLNDEVLRKLSFDTDCGHLGMAMPSEFSTTLLPIFINSFSRIYPNYKLDVAYELDKNLKVANSKKYDFTLVVEDETELDSQAQLLEDELVWVANRDYAVSLAKTLLLVVPPQGCIYRNRAVQALDDAGLPWGTIYTIPDLTGIQSTLNEVVGVGVMPKSTVPESLKIIPSLPLLGKIGVSLKALKSDHQEGANRLADCIRLNLSCA